MDWNRFQELVRASLRDDPVDVVLERDTNLIELGLDSFGMVALVTALEQEFDVVLPDDALTLDTFRTMATVWDLVHELRTTATRHEGETWSAQAAGFNTLH